MHEGSVVSPGRPVNVQSPRQRPCGRQRSRWACFSSLLGQSHDRPASDLDLGVLETTASTAIPAAFGLRGRLVAAAFHDTPIEDHFDTPLLPEHHAQRLVELSPTLRHDEEEPLHRPYSSTGRCWAHGRARSNAAEARSTVVSSNRRPTICSPIGKPSFVKPHGTDEAGWPVTLNG